ncbi:MAG: Jag N-terminal domain-containing protein, partial [Elusimicrobia bacterium]|nr:Jag N-terminal domain-containing protein [Elusimicrobiota bacterium]
MKEIECEGKTVTIAVEAGLKDIGLRRDQVEVQVLDEGSAGILGFGAKPARVLIREKRWGDAPAPVNPPPSKPAASRPRLSSARPVKQPRPSARASAPPPAKAPEPKPAPRPEPRPEPRRETARPEPRREHRAE